LAKQPDISSLASGFRSSNKLNENFDEIKESFENTLSRDGSGPNEMLAVLDMNSHRIINTADPINGTDVVNLNTLQDYIGEINGDPDDDLDQIHPIQLDGRVSSKYTLKGFDFEDGVYWDNMLSFGPNRTWFPGTNAPFDDRNKNYGNQAITFIDLNLEEMGAFGVSGPIVGTVHSDPQAGSAYYPNLFYMMSNDLSSGRIDYGPSALAFGVDILPGAMLKTYLGVNPHPFSPSEPVNPAVPAIKNPVTWQFLRHEANDGITTFRGRYPGLDFGQMFFRDLDLYFGTPGQAIDQYGRARAIFMPMANTQAAIRETNFNDMFGITTNIDPGATAPRKLAYSAWAWSLGGGLDQYRVQRMAPNGVGGWKRMFEILDDGIFNSRGAAFQATGTAKTMGISSLVSGTVTIPTTAAKSGCVVLMSRRNAAGTIGTDFKYSSVDNTSITIQSITSTGAAAASDTSSVGWTIINQCDL